MDRRRKTLAGLSPSQMNSRASFAPSRVTTDGKNPIKPSLLGRPSLIGLKVQPHNAPSRPAVANYGPRRSSTYGKPSSGVKPDPRPVNDKAFQASCIRCLIGFLSTHGYDQPISPKLLASPMSKDFTAIVHFLMRKVDPNQNAKLLGKIEDDVPNFFKRLRYPFQISKSSLFAVGSPHTWPGLLASLVWIAELLSYAEKAEQNKDSLEDEKQRAESEFFNYISESYRCFLAGDDDQCEQVDKAKAAEFEEKADEIKQHNQTVNEDIAKLREQIEAMRNTPSPLSVAKVKKEEHEADREKFKKTIESLQNQKKTLQIKLQERQADIKSRSEQLAQAQQECQVLQKRIDAQTFNKDDIIRMNDEKAKRDDVLRSAESAREALQQKCRSQEVAVEQCLDELEIRIQGYNSAADRLQLIPITAKHSGGVQFEAKLSRGGITPTEMLNVDFKGTVKATLNRVRDAAVGRGRQLVEESLSLQEKRDSLSHALTERTEENATLTTQVHKLEKQLLRSKEERETEIRVIQSQAEQIKTEVSVLKNSTTHSFANSSSRVSSVQREYEETLQACEIERAAVEQDLAAALHMIWEHKEKISNTVETALLEVQAVQGEICIIAKSSEFTEVC